MLKSKAMLTLALALAVLEGCLTPEPAKPVVAEQPAPRVRTQFAIRKGETKKNPAPLPAYTPYYIDWAYSDGSKESFLGYKVWTFSESGAPQYVEVLNETGAITERFYDFDADGTPDLSKRLTTAPTSPAKPSFESFFSEEAPLENSP